MTLSTAEQNIIELVREEKVQSFQEGYNSGKNLTYCTDCGDKICGKEPSLCENCAS